nr:L,D-transpeptidase [Spelaeibacter cavernicola]
MTAVAAPASARNGAPCDSSAAACLDLSGNQAWLMNGGAVTYGPVPVTHGRPGYETPPGTFYVNFKDANFWSTAYNAPMPYSVFFNGGIAFHEGSLSDLSHGCVHLSHAAAVTFFNALSPGDVVEVVS